MFALNTSSIDAARDLNFTADLGISDSALTLLKIYNTVVLVVGVLGNAVVLTGLLNPRFMKIDATSRVLLQNLAVTDILYTLFQFLPSLTTLFTRSWVYGPVLCLIAQIAATVFAVNEIHVVTLLSCYRLWFVHHRAPGPGSATSRRTAGLVAAGVLLHDVVIHVAYHMTESTVTGYDREVLSCNVLRSRRDWQMGLGIYNIVLPILLTLAANSATVCAILRTLARSRQQPAYRRATLTILTICIAFLLSYIPYFVQMSGAVSSPAFRLSSMYFLSVNIVLHPFVYVIADRREFGKFVKLAALEVACELLQCYEKVYTKIAGGFSEEDSTSNYSFQLINIRR